MSIQAALKHVTRYRYDRLIALGAIRKDAAACLIEPDSVTSRKYLMAVDSIIRTFPTPAQLPKDTAGAGYRSNFEAGWV